MCEWVFISVWLQFLKWRQQWILKQSTHSQLHGFLHAPFLSCWGVCDRTSLSESLETSGRTFVAKWKLLLGRNLLINEDLRNGLRSYEMSWCRLGGCLYCLVFLFRRFCSRVSILDCWAMWLWIGKQSREIIWCFDVTSSVCEKREKLKSL